MRVVFCKKIKKTEETRNALSPFLLLDSKCQVVLKYIYNAQGFPEMSKASFGGSRAQGFHEMSKASFGGSRAGANI